MTPHLRALAGVFALSLAACGGGGGGSSTLACGPCAGLETCGGGGTPGQCGCTPRTCAEQGLACGPAGDGCGGELDCGDCTAPQACGGAGVAGACGLPVSCTNLCLRQVACAGGGTTTVTGRAFAPNGVDPLSGALVYVPNAALEPFTPGVSCAAPVSGSPLVTATTGVDGSFTLRDVPAGDAIPLVLQKGRWRRVFTIPAVAACADTALADGLIRLPRNKAEGDIPRVAAVTGNTVVLECTLRQLGVADSEFSAPEGPGRIHLYPAAQGGGAKVSGTTTDSALWASQDRVNGYDAVFLACPGTDVARSADQLATFAAYINAGGRALAEHYAYVWLYQNPPFSTVVHWNVNQTNPPSPANTAVSLASQAGAALADWLMLVGASTTHGQLRISNLRNDVDQLSANALSWLDLTSGVDAVPKSFSFRTPVGAPPAQVCGEVLFQDFHVTHASVAPGTIFPAECPTGGATPQEKLTAYQFLELTGSTAAPALATCTPRTCEQLGSTCGTVADGCGGSVSCGTCPAGKACGGGVTRTCAP